MRKQKNGFHSFAKRLLRAIAFVNCVSCQKQWRVGELRELPAIFPDIRFLICPRCQGYLLLLEPLSIRVAYQAAIAPTPKGYLTLGATIMRFQK